jgi:hypothetical protein
VVFFVVSMVALIAQTVYKIVKPDSAPQGTTILVTLVVFLGSLNLLAISIVGAYVGTILEETKRRPRFLRDSVIRFGRVVPSSQSDEYDLVAEAQRQLPSPRLESSEVSGVTSNGNVRAVAPRLR